jgi:hypothetical protein
MRFRVVKGGKSGSGLKLVSQSRKGLFYCSEYKSVRTEIERGIAAMNSPMMVRTSAAPAVAAEELVDRRIDF